MHLLACDTSSSCGSLALYKFKESTCQLLSHSTWQKSKSHSELITTEFKSCLQAADLDLPDLTALAVGIGPGSFTGLRVGINFIKSLAYSLKLPIIAMNSLEILAQTSTVEDGNILCSNYAFKNLCYTAGFKKQNGQLSTTIKTQALSFDELQRTISEPHLGLGTAFKFFENKFSEEFNSLLTLTPNAIEFPSAVDLGRVACENYEKLKKINWKELVPLYVRDSEAEEKLRSGALKPVTIFNLD